MFFSKEKREKKRFRKSLSNFVDLSLAQCSSLITDNEIKLMIWYIIGISLEAYKSLKLNKEDLYNMNKEYLLSIGIDKKITMITLSAFKSNNINETELKYVESGVKYYKTWVGKKSYAGTGKLEQLLLSDRQKSNIDINGERDTQITKRFVDLFSQYAVKKD